MTSEIQSIMFSREYFGIAKANAWMKEHGFAPIKKIHVTKNYLRARINDPKMYKEFDTKPIAKGYDQIKFVIGMK